MIHMDQNPDWDSGPGGGWRRWLSGGVWVCLQRLCRRTEQQQSSPDTLMILCQIQRNTQGWWWTWLCVWQWSCSQISSDCSTETHLHFFWFLCQSLLDEALLSTLPPSNMAQSESLYTQAAAAAAAASTSLDHQDTADPLSTRTPGCSLTLTEITSSPISESPVYSLDSP